MQTDLDHNSPPIAEMAQYLRLNALGDPISYSVRQLSLLFNMSEVKAELLVNAYAKYRIKNLKSNLQKDSDFVVYFFKHSKN